MTELYIGESAFTCDPCMGWFLKEPLCPFHADYPWDWYLTQALKRWVYALYWNDVHVRRQR